MCNSFKIPGVDEEIFMVPDPPHTLKNQRNGLFNNGYFMLDEDHVKQLDLKSPYVKFDYIRKLIEFQAERQLKICPHLSYADLELGQFNKMKVKYAKHVLSRETANALIFCIEHYPEEFPIEAMTTAVFCAKVGQYYDQVTCRGRGQAFSYDRPEKFQEAIENLEWFRDFYASMKINPKQKSGLWPTQKGVIMATDSIISLAKYMLEQPGVKFFRPGLVSNDPIENFHSQARAKNPMPTCLGFIRRLKAICMCQCLDGPVSGSYDHDEGSSFLIDIKEAKERKAKEEERKAKEDEMIESAVNANNEAEEILIEVEEDSYFAEIMFPVTEDDENDEVPDDIAEINASSYVNGYLLHKTIMTKSKCTNCQNQFVADENDDQLCNQLIRLKDYKAGALCRGTPLFNDMMQLAERIFRQENDNLKYQKKTRLGDKIASKILLYWKEHYPDAPDCHLKLIATRYTKLRLFFWSNFVSQQLVKQQQQRYCCHCLSFCYNTSS